MSDTIHINSNHPTDCNFSHTIKELMEFISIPSVSTGTGNQSLMHNAASWLLNKLTKLGAVNACIYETDKYPIVFAEFASFTENAPTILIYGHYDVQPAGPLGEWSSDPFNPEIINDHLIGRGASDMKGQMIACLAAINTFRTEYNLPLHIKVLFEGEEEIGSPSLAKFLTQYKDRLQSDLCLVPDSIMLSRTLPTITYGLRGLANFELNIWSSQDLHSGIYGGVVCNPANEAARLISGIQDSGGKITIEHFYDDVAAIPDREHEDFNKLPVNHDYYKKATGAHLLWGESGFTPVERVGARPSFDVTGFSAGHSDPGFKTIIPSHACVKLSFRLVPNQNPESIQSILFEYINKNIFKGLQWKLDLIDGSRPSIVDRNSPGVLALANAMLDIWGVNPAFYRMGGTIPVVGLVNQILGIDTIITGFGLPDDNIHSPNERLHLPTWEKGINTLIRFFLNLSEQTERKPTH